jgi:hypothetical protein
MSEERRRRPGAQAADGPAARRHGPLHAGDAGAAQEQSAAHPPLDRNARVLRSQDLKNLLDRLENMARNGAKDAVRELLQQLEQMMENLQMATPDMNGDDLGDMMQEWISAGAAPSADRKADKGKRVIRDSKASRASKASEATRLATCGNHALGGRRPRKDRYRPDQQCLQGARQC